MRGGRTRVDLETAWGKSRATACWASTDEASVLIPLRVRKVPVEGQTGGRVAGSIAWTGRTQEWLPPMRRAYGGVLGSQDINICAQR